jgi:hypothetical protein
LSPSSQQSAKRLPSSRYRALVARLPALIPHFAVGTKHEWRPAFCRSPHRNRLDHSAGPPTFNEPATRPAASRLAAPFPHTGPYRSGLSARVNARRVFTAGSDKNPGAFDQSNIRVSRNRPPQRRRARTGPSPGRTIRTLDFRRQVHELRCRLWVCRLGQQQSIQVRLVGQLQAKYASNPPTHVL